MKLRHVHEGDIVRVAGLHAVVIDKEPHRLIVRGIAGTRSLRRVRAVDVEAHWRRSKTRVAA